MQIPAQTSLFNADAHNGHMHDPAWAMLSSMDVDLDIQWNTKDKGIVWNLEPMIHSKGFNYHIVSAMISAGKKIYDFGRRNCDEMRKVGIKCTWFPVRWTPGLQAWVDLVPDQERELDVVVIATETPRRAAITERLRASGLNVASYGCLYGTESTRVMKTAKVCLCVHREGKNQEQAQLRIAWALSCGTVPVCEESFAPSITGFFPEVPYDQIVGAVADTLERWTPEVPAKILKQFQAYSRVLEGGLNG
jgi:hypothetical protein